LNAAANFFETLKGTAEVEVRMAENAKVYRRMSELLLDDPTAIVNGRTNAQLAAVLLRESATFFMTLGQQNEPVLEQMTQNSEVYRATAAVLEVNPVGQLPVSHAVPQVSLPKENTLLVRNERPTNFQQDHTLELTTSRLRFGKYWTVVPGSQGLGAWRESIFKRDFYTCQYCGLQSKKYHNIIAENGVDWVTNKVFTACIFCSLCLALETVEPMRSGVLIWLPQMSQVMLNRLMQVVYVSRIRSDVHADKARQILERLLQRRRFVVDRLSSDVPSFLVGLMANCETTEELCSVREKISDIRLLPLDRRIIRQVDLEFNQFPQILAYWRSNGGPFPKVREAEQIALLDSVLNDAAL